MGFSKDLTLAQQHKQQVIKDRNERIRELLPILNQRFSKLQKTLAQAGNDKHIAEGVLSLLASDVNGVLAVMLTGTGGIQ